MKRIAKKEDLPKWFSLKNYQVFRRMTDVELIEQILARRELYNLEIRAYINLNQTSEFLNMSDDDRSDFNPEVTDPYYSQIVNSLPDLRSVLNSFSFNSIKQHPYTLKNAQGIFPLTFRHVIGLKESYNRALSSVSGFCPTTKNIDHDKLEQSIDYWREYNEEKYWFMPERGLNVNINLRDLTDTQILNELKSLLPLWREKLLKPEPKGLKSRADDYQKIKDYELFAYFDLSVWAEVNDCNITDHLMANCLYESGKYNEKSAEWGENHIKQTLKPFYEKVFSYRYKPYKSR